MKSVVPQLARLLNCGTMTGIPEAKLLEEFIARKDEAAFEAIVTRYGPMVLNVCRQLLHNPEDVEDAFQATFIVLVRRAASLRNRELLGNWLYGVAYRVALRSRSLASRRESRFSRSVEVETLSSPQAESAEPSDEDFLKLHETIGHLPDRYRIPIVLCYLEGLTHEEAAERLGWPLGSVKGRLARARDLLRTRLTRRGVGLSAGSLLASAEKARAVVVPSLLQTKTVRSAMAIAGESARAFATTSAISLTVATLAQGVIRTMVVSQIRAAVLPLLIGVGLVSTGASVVAFQSQGGADPADAQSKPVASQGEKSPTQAQPKPAPGQSGQSQAQKANPSKGGNDLQRPMMQGQAGKQPGHAGGGGGFGGVVPSKGWNLESKQRQHNAILAAVIAEGDKNPKTIQILTKLEEPIAMDFANETPLEDFLKYIQSATSDKNYHGIPIYVDPRGLQEAEKTLQSPVTIKLEGVPLKATLRLILKQLGLAYCIHDGFLMISDPRGVHEELEEARAELGIPDDQGPSFDFPEAGFQGVGDGGFGGGMGGMGGMGGGMR